LRNTRVWARRFRRPALATLAVVLVAMVVTPLFGRKQPPVSQPIAFNHRKHTQDLELGCDFCHKYFQTGAHSGLPGAETCGICHSVLLGKTEAAAKLTELVTDGEPLRFNKLFRLPDYVFFTHRRHVAVGELDCAVCHDGIAETEAPPGLPLVTIKMAFCLDCHRDRSVTTDCTACHR